MKGEEIRKAKTMKPVIIATDRGGLSRIGLSPTDHYFYGEFEETCLDRDLLGNAPNAAFLLRAIRMPDECRLQPVTDEERALCEKPEEYWLVDGDGPLVHKACPNHGTGDRLWRANITYWIRKDTELKKREPRWVTATATTRRNFEEPEGAEWRASGSGHEWADSTSVDKGVVWGSPDQLDTDFRYPADARLVPREPGPEFVPWSRDDVPLGAEVVSPSGRRGVITVAGEDKVWCFHGAFGYRELLGGGYKWRAPNSQDVPKPCGLVKK